MTGVSSPVAHAECGVGFGNLTDDVDKSFDLRRVRVYTEPGAAGAYALDASQEEEGTCRQGTAQPELRQSDPDACRDALWVGSTSGSGGGSTMGMANSRVQVAGSARTPLAGARAVGGINKDERVAVTVRVRPGGDGSAPALLPIHRATRCRRAAICPAPSFDHDAARIHGTSRWSPRSPRSTGSS